MTDAHETGDSMPRDFSLDTVGGMLDDLKSRLGFSRDEDRYESDDYDYE